MKRLNLIIALVLVLILAGSAAAYPTLNDILGDPAPAIAPTDMDFATLLNIDQNSTATLLLESAGYANQNVFGMYNPNDSDEKLELFDGAASPIDSVVVEFDILGGTAKNLNTMQVANIGTVFGFYLISPDGTFYSDRTLNPGGCRHGLLYDTDAYTGVITGDPDTVVAFEDLLNLGDQDWNDMVVGMTNVTPTPEPATMVLLGLGGLAATRLQRKKIG